MNINNHEILDHLNRSASELNTAIVKLTQEAQSYYRINDNFRGNIRYDAAKELELKLRALRTSIDYLSKALEK